MDIFEQIVDARRRKTPAVLITVTQTTGSTPRKAGAKMLFCEDGRQHGSIGGGAVEHALQSAAQNVMKTGVAEVITYKLTTDLAMCCGGQMTFFVEPLMVTPSLFVFGCGHVGSAIVRAASALGFEITAIDELESNANSETLSQANTILNSYDVSDFKTLQFTSETIVLIATREHHLDQKILEFCLKQPFLFLGVIGSQRKAAMQRERLKAKGYDENAIKKVICPVGLDIAAQTPEEIAVSVCAQLIQIKNNRPQ